MDTKTAQLADGILAVPAMATATMSIRRRSWLVAPFLLAWICLACYDVPALPAFRVTNDTDETLIIMRIGSGSKARKMLRTGEWFVDRGSTAPFIKGLDGMARRGENLVYGIIDSDGNQQGRIMLTARYLKNSGGTAICLSAASDPPYLIDSREAMERACTLGSAMP